MITLLLTLIAQNAPPTASFTATPEQGPPTLTVNVDGSASTDSDGTIASWAWDWGDGSPPGAGVTGSHGYPATGTYVITLTVTDNGGATGTTTKQVHCLTASNVVPSCFLSAAPDVGPAALFTVITGIGLDSAGNLEHRYDFGDGSPYTIYPSVVHHGSSTASHTYASPGTYVVTMRVTDSEGCWAEGTFTVVVTAAGGGGGGSGGCGATGAEALLLAGLLALWRRRVAR